jgi:hypothetical protein
MVAGKGSKFVQCTDCPAGNFPFLKDKLRLDILGFLDDIFIELYPVQISKYCTGGRKSACTRYT